MECYYEHKINLFQAERINFLLVWFTQTTIRNGEHHLTAGMWIHLKAKVLVAFCNQRHQQNIYYSFCLIAHLNNREVKAMWCSQYSTIITMTWEDEISSKSNDDDDQDEYWDLRNGYKRIVKTFLSHGDNDSNSFSYSLNALMKTRNV